MSENALTIPQMAFTLEEMRANIDNICDLGQAILDTHMNATLKSAEQAEAWQLTDRLTAESAALRRYFDITYVLIAAADEYAQFLDKLPAEETAVATTLETYSATIETHLAELDMLFIKIRHSALDLLLWAERFAPLADTDLTQQYRQSYATLITTKPELKNYHVRLREATLRFVGNADLHTAVHKLISAFNRYIAMIDSARGFVQAIADPPLDLVFYDTTTFDADLETLSLAEKAQLTTELNDCCELLLYNQAEFDQRVTHLRPKLSSGFDASLYILAINEEMRVIFSVDEDPVFEEIGITLYRIVQHQFLDAAQEAIKNALYKGLLAQ